ncbi:YncE family protein [Paracoccus shanxieyensis]|uniref:PQQ-binding-like beta-propeller repeat protein n=1 Tax=Paracoccus shanxieyensis TaxID=2675752 RepID=A0A6L6J3J1_9RHOB|nr:PQQ-binding-like beta-propeller repeat protein [Paracoccus shanxieyensis]MTH66418.1 PQQ-binding-like beta-propeller repeat protein [Paracoccus shanxieyensis]MTH89649.1 PQQ-binding-like beta-propeller repeat protein [Paracoccus shanxieyensis]
MIRLFAALLVAGSAQAADLAFVTSQNADMLSVVDLVSGEVIASASVPGAPAPVAYDAAHGRAYVIAAKTGRLSVVDQAGRELHGLDLPEGAFGVAAAPDGGVFITEWYQGRLIRLDAGLRQIWSVPTGRAPAGVATADGLVAVADRDDDRVSIYDAASGARLHSVAVGQHPYSVTFHDGRVWTADVQSDTVSVIDPVAGRLLGQVPTGSHPYGVAFAGGRGFVTDQYAGTVTVFDPATLAATGTLETGDYPEGIAPLPDGSGVVVAHWDSNTLVWIDAASLTITRQIELPDGPRAFGSFTGRTR